MADFSRRWLLTEPNRSIAATGAEGLHLAELWRQAF
jgi:hypothetical protein